MNTYVVIGSNSFTGSHMVDELLSDSDNEVIGISRSPEYDSLYLPYTNRSAGNFRFFQIDIVKEFEQLHKLLDEIKPYTVINVAALSEVGLSNDRPFEYYLINTLAVTKLCDYLRKASYDCRYVHISSGEVFGSCSVPVLEDSAFRPSTPYAVSKASADLHLATLAENFDFPAYIIRSTNVYGRHQQLFKIIPRTVIYLMLNKEIELHGGGLSIKSFVHVKDVVRGMLLALKKGNPGTYHFSTDNEDTIRDIVENICDNMDYDFGENTRDVGDRLGQDARYWLDCTKAKDQLEWYPQMDFKDGLKDVIDWVQSNWATIRNEPLSYTHKI